MTDFLHTPNLPERPVRQVLIGDLPRIFVDLLKNHGIRTIHLKRNPGIDPAIAAHADAQVFHLGQGRIFADVLQCEVLSSMFPDATVTPCNVAGAYPADCALNVLHTGGICFANQKCVDRTLLQALKQRGVQQIHVNQGYTKCSAVLIAPQAILTDDPSIADAAQRTGFEVCLIQKGDVVLPGHPYGLIGGACAMIAPNKLLFFGDVRLHRDSEKIVRFLSSHGCEYTSLPSVSLTDVGGIVPVC